VPSLAEGLRRVKQQASRTPPPHWVQVIGGWTPAQFAEKRFPTLDEINAATGDTPCMVMCMYDRAWLNRAAIRVLGWNKDMPNMFGGVIERDASGNPTGLVVATTSLASLVSVWLRIPRLPPEEQALSTRHFMREHNRLGVTSVIDAGGGGQNYPDNYQAIAALAAENQLTLRIGYTLFAQTPGKELDNYMNWSKLVKVGQGDDYFRMIGAGEYILFAAGDVTNFAKDYTPPPAIMESQLAAVTKYVAELGWPFRQHTSFDASASRVLDVVEQVNREVPMKNLRWGLDHCETLQPKTLERVARLGGSINIQNRMSTDGEAFVAKYGSQVAADAPPVARIRELALPLACGTDANRANTYNPWIGLHWLVTGKTLGGAKLQSDRNLLDRTEALRLYTAGGAWISSEEGKKGTLEVGKLADLVVLSDDYFNVPEDSIKDIESVLTMVGGKVVYAAGPYARLDLPAPPINSDWLPIKHYGSYYKHATAGGLPLASRGHAHQLIVGANGAWSLDCACGAF
jgi:predicted amidohydrolase YtcJ